jgi:hypothetical protein
MCPGSGRRSWCQPRCPGCLWASSLKQPRQTGRSLAGVVAFDVTGLWEVSGRYAEDDLLTEEHIWLDQSPVGPITGFDVDEDGQRTADPFVVEGSGLYGNQLRFTQVYLDGTETFWTAVVSRHSNGVLVMMDGQWSGGCNGTFTATKLRRNLRPESEAAGVVVERDLQLRNADAVARARSDPGGGRKRIIVV